MESDGVFFLENAAEVLLEFESGWTRVRIFGRRSFEGWSGRHTNVCRFEMCYFIFATILKHMGIFFPGFFIVAIWTKQLKAK